MTEQQKKLADEEIAKLQELQNELTLDKFDEEDAWKMGVYMHDIAVKNNYSVGMSISLNRKKLFHHTTKGSAPLSDDWLRRKENTVYKFFKSSFEMAYFLRKNDQTANSRYGLPHEDYAIAGGAFPICVKGVGVVGAVAVTGLPEEKDHALAVEGITYIKSLQK